MNALIYIDYIFRGIITGFLVAYLIVLGLRPAVMYPDDILDIIDNPWIFLILLILNYYIFLWDTTIGLLMFLTIIALILDIVLFTDGGIIKENVEIFSNKTLDTIQNVHYIPETSDNSKSFKDINNIILKKLKELRTAHMENTSITSEPPPFI